MFSADKVKFEHFAWAASVVMSRAWGVVPEGRQESVHVLCPLVDLFNHRLLARSVHFSPSGEGQQWMEVRVTGDLELGQEIFVSYGTKCNRLMLSEYGFAFADNNILRC